jgi:hypothetical protein
MTSVFLDVPYHQQDQDTWCGLAVVQMVLAARGANPPPDQAGLGLGKSSSAGSEVQVLNDLLNGGGDWGFRVSTNPNYGAALRGVVDSILTSGLAVPTLVFGPEHHWVLVKGVLLDGDAQPGGPYTVRGLYVANPSPVTAAEVAEAAGDVDTIHQDYGDRPMPHQQPDACGKGGPTGVKSAFVSEYAWRVQHWLATEGDRPTPFVTILNRGSASNTRPAIDVFTPPVLATLPWNATPAAAQAAALAGIRANGLDKTRPFGTAFVDVQVGYAQSVTEGTPVPGVWWRVGLQRSLTGEPVGSAAVAADGTFLGAIAPDAPSVTPYALLQVAFKDLTARAGAFRDVLGNVPLRRDEVQAVGSPFWQVCADSQQRYYAFLRLRVREHELIVGVDGRVRRYLRPSACRWTEHAQPART